VLTVYRLSLGLYKCWSMGILPTGAADWLQFETRLPVSFLCHRDGKCVELTL
jgi:hypothetical protein